MYKKSMYNSVIDNIEDGVLVFNTFTSAILWVPGELWNRDEFHGEIDDDMALMIENGIWVEAEKDEYKEFEKIMREAIKCAMEEISFTIVPTYACNMKCDYCFQKDENEVFMNQEMADRVFDSVTYIMKKYKKTRICWFGGEPLLAIDIIEYLSNKFIHFCNDNDIVYNAEIITNGTLLVPKVIETLIRCKVSLVQVTLDGTGHDVIRKMKNGLSSYNVIVKNIKNAVDLLTIVLRSNVSELNIEQIKEMIDDLLINHNLRNKLYFSFYPVSKFEGKETKNHQYQQFCKLNYFDSNVMGIIRHVMKYQPISSISNTDIKTSSVPCEAVCKDIASFDVYGDVYKCMLAMQNVEMRIGNILDDNIETILDKDDQNGWLSFEWSDECRNCNLLPMCHSGCIYRRRAAGLTKVSTLDKDLHKEIIKLRYEQMKDKS